MNKKDNKKLIIHSKNAKFLMQILDKVSYCCDDCENKKKIKKVLTK